MEKGERAFPLDALYAVADVCEVPRDFMVHGFGGGEALSTERAQVMADAIVAAVTARGQAMTDGVVAELAALRAALSAQEAEAMASQAVSGIPSRRARTKPA
jgi:hypothetical protein